MFLVTDALAQGASGGGSSNPTLSLILQMLQFVPIFLILYFLLIRPQQQQAKKLKHMIAALKKGDKVVTSGGIVGTVVGLDDARLVLRIAEDVKVEFVKSAVVQVVAEPGK